MKKTIILYGSSHKYSGSHKRVSHSAQPEYYVRMETHPGTLEDALIAAKPHNGEVVLNTVDSITEEK